MGIMLLCAYITAIKNYFHTGYSVIKGRSFLRVETLFPIILFAIIFGMRYDVGFDYVGYLYGYIKHIDVGKGEILFNAFTHLFQDYDFHFIIYFGTIAFIQVFFFFYAFKKERFLFPLLVFFLFMNDDFMFWMNVIRQSLAMCIWIFSLKYIEQRQFWKYLMWCLVAYGFHNSAITLIILYPILRNGKDYFKNISIQLIILCGAFVIQQIFARILPSLIPTVEHYVSFLGSDQYEGYIRRGLEVEAGTSNGTGLAYFFKIALNVVIVCFSKHLKNFYKSKRFRIIYSLFFIGLVTLYMFPVGSIVLTRPFRYFYVFQMIMYAHFGYFLFKAKNVRYKYILAGLIVAFLGIFYLHQITADNDSHLWFQFYFQQNGAIAKY